jgi:acyl carrier protein
MEENEIFERLKEKVLIPYFSADLEIPKEGYNREINLNSRLEEDLGADSLDKYELIYNTEEEFGIRIHEEDPDVGEIKTVGEAVKYIKKITSPEYSWEKEKKSKGIESKVAEEYVFRDDIQTCSYILPDDEYDDFD